RVSQVAVVRQAYLRQGQAARIEPRDDDPRRPPGAGSVPLRDHRAVDPPEAMTADRLIIEAAPVQVRSPGLALRRPDPPRGLLDQRQGLGKRQARWPL